MNRDETIDRIWREVEYTVFISRLEFVAGLVGWEILPKKLDGEIVGATLTNGPEFHFVVFGAKKPFTRALMIDCVQPILDKYGFVRTKTPKEDTRQRRFNVAVGFVIESTDEFFTYFRMERLKLHGGITPCQS